MLTVLLCALLAIAGLILAVLVLPVTIRLAVARENPDVPPALAGSVGLASGLVGVEVKGGDHSLEMRGSLFGRAVPRPVYTMGTDTSDNGPAKAKPAESVNSEAADPTKKAGRPTPSRRSQVRRIQRLMRVLGSPALRLVGSMPRTLSLRRLSLSGQFGFPDPAQTGRVLGLLQALQVHTWRRLQIRVRPDWVGSEMRLRGELLLHFHLGLLLLLIIRCAAQMAWRWILSWIASLAWRPGAAR